MRFHKGKSFIAPLKLFRDVKALYFPNLQGVTLASPRLVQDTTTVLTDKVTVVSIFTRAWAENQTATFLGNNPALDAILKRNEDFLQRVEINIEENTMQANLVKWFMGSLRRNRPVETHGRYFLVRRGITDDMRDEIGLLNNRVGYIYIVDGQCRIRWAGSGRAEGVERESLVKGVEKLVEEMRKTAARKEMEAELQKVTEAAKEADAGLPESVVTPEEMNNGSPTRATTMEPPVRL